MAPGTNSQKGLSDKTGLGEQRPNSSSSLAGTERFGSTCTKNMIASNKARGI